MLKICSNSFKEPHSLREAFPNAQRLPLGEEHKEKEEMLN